MCLFKTFSNSRKILWGGKTHGKSEDDTSETPFKLKKKNKLALNCMLNKNHDRPKCCHPSMAIFPKSKGLGNWVQVNERGMRVIHPKFCSDVILENQHQENQSFETVGIIDLRLIRLHWQIISLAFPAFCEKIDFTTFPAQFPKMAPFVASPVISAFPAWPETLL